VANVKPSVANDETEFKVSTLKHLLECWGVDGRGMCAGRGEEISVRVLVENIMCKLCIFIVMFMYSSCYVCNILCILSHCVVLCTVCV
jgi:hypothetical protein